MVNFMLHELYLHFLKILPHTPPHSASPVLLDLTASRSLPAKDTNPGLSPCLCADGRADSALPSCFGSRASPPCGLPWPGRPHPHAPPTAIPHLFLSFFSLYHHLRAYVFYLSLVIFPPAEQKVLEGRSDQALLLTSVFPGPRTMPGT